MTEFRVKIFGAGSIGNHLCHASRVLGWHVDLCDIDGDALRRAREEIYPSRYGAWDETIGLYHADDAPRGGYNLIVVGIPPDHHVDVAMTALEEEPAALLIEKPICGPGLEGASELLRSIENSPTKSFVGYNHVVGSATKKVEEVLASGTVGVIETIDAEVREHWGGIFAAHPWLAGPSDSYLGFTERGGGAVGEHSHALNLWQHFACLAGAGRVSMVSASAAYVSDSGANYDKISAINLTTESGLVGRVVQDVITRPPRKWGRIQGEKGCVEWHFEYKAGIDAVFWEGIDGSGEHLVEKTRPDDFIAELMHISEVVRGEISESPISIDRGLDTALVVAAAHKSARQGEAVHIDFSKGYNVSALHSR